MRRLLFASLLLLAACGDNQKPPTDEPADAAVTPIDAPLDVDASVTTACALDRPGELARPPSGTLPCDLLPPGFAQ